MSLLYNISQDAFLAHKFVELGITESSFSATKASISSWLSQSSNIPLIPDSPVNYSNLRWWFKMDSLTASYSQSQTVTSWPNSAPGYTGESMTFTGVSPTFNTGSMSGSSIGQSAPTLRFSQSVGTTPSSFTSNGTLMVMSKNCYDTVMNNAFDCTLQRRNVQNDYYVYNGSIGTGGSAGVTLSGAITQSVTMTFVFDSGVMTFYEGTDTRGSRGPNLTLNKVAPESVADIAEICMWSNPTKMTQGQITSLYKSYWRQKYFYEPMYELSDPATQSFSSVELNTVTVSGRLIETLLCTNKFSISIIGDMTTRCFSETGLGSPPYIDPVVADWASRVVTNGGAAPSSNTKKALTTFYTGLVSAGISSKMIAVNCFVPDNLIASITPLIKVSGYDPWTNNSFIDGDITVDGLKGNAASKWLNTGVNPSTSSMTINNGGLTLYNTFADASTTNEFAAWINPGYMQLLCNYGGGNYFDCYTNGGSGRIGGTALPNGLGFTSGNRTDASNQYLYKASSTVAFTQAAGPGGSPGASMPNGNLYLFGANNGGGPGFLSAKRFSFAAIHNGLSSSEAQALYNLVQAMRISLGGGYV